MFFKMEFTRFLFPLTLTIMFLVLASGEEEVSSPLRVAQCRATCLQKFSNDGPSGESMCLQGPDCFMCWENCELLQSNFQVWGTMCQEKDICDMTYKYKPDQQFWSFLVPTWRPKENDEQFPGCQEACRFHAEASTRPQQSQPVIHTKGEGVVRVNGALARWPPPSAQPKTPLVYVVMRRSANGPWRQIIQTIDLATRVPANNGGALLRVLVVDPQGLVTIYSPDENYNKQDLTLKKKKKINTEIIATTPETSITDFVDDVWSLKEVSLIHQKVLVIGEIAWEPRTNKGVYLVTWEVDGGGLKGNLFTDSTCVTLSLWPDTIYHIQVELVSRRPGIENEKSEMMTLDTGRALKVSTESMEDVKIMPDSGKRSADDTDSVDHLYSVLVSSMRGEHIAANRQNMELILGCFTAVSLFVAILLVLAWKCKRQGTFPGTNVYVGDSSLRSRKLVEDFQPVHGFQPILTMVSDVPTKSRGISSATTSPVHPARPERRPEVQV